MKNYTFDFAKNALTISDRFNKRAMDPANEEYATLLKLKSDFPGLRIYVKPTPKRKNTSARLTYDKMVKYLSCQPDSERLLLMFNHVREDSKSKGASYQYVRQWFLKNFPEYFQYPSFDEHGNLINPRGAAKTETTQKTTTIDFSDTAA